MNNLTIDFRQIIAAVRVVECTTSLSAMLQAATAEIVKLLECDVATLTLLEPGQIRPKLVATGKFAELFESYQLQSTHSNGLLEIALRESHTVFNEGFLPPDCPHIYQQAKLDYGVALPLFRQGQIVGVFGIFRQSKAFQPAETELFEIYSAQVGPILSAYHKIKILETAIQSRDELLSVASHDLRNPLTALRGFSQLTVRNIDRIPETQPLPRTNILSNLQRIIKQSNTLDKLIGKLLDVSRINTGRLEIQPFLLDLAELVRTTAQDVMTGLAQNEADEGLVQHRLEFDIIDEPLFGQFDGERIAQVLTALLDNAVKFSSAGSVVRVELQRVALHTAELRVTDYGIGMTEEKQALLFQRWQRLATSELGENSSLGLGLFICRGLIERHGGQIRLESRLGHGTSFIVTLPVHNEETDAN